MEKRKVYLEDDYIYAPAYHGVLHPYFWDVFSPYDWVLVDPAYVRKRLKDIFSLREDVLERIKNGELYLPEEVEVPPPEYKVYYAGGYVRVLLPCIHGYLHPLLFEPSEFLCEERLDWSWGLLINIKGKEYVSVAFPGYPYQAREIKEKIERIIKFRQNQPIRY